MSNTYANVVTISSKLHIRLRNSALFRVNQNATLEINTGTTFYADDSSTAAIVNQGYIYLNPYVVPIGQDIKRALGDPSFASKTSSVYAALEIHGVLQQSSPGTVVVTVDNSYQNVSIISISTNESFSGNVYVHFANHTYLQLPYYGATTTSAWSLISFSYLNGSDGSPPVFIESSPGITLMPDYTKGANGYTESVVVESIACSDILEFYSGASSSQNYYCHLCSMNSSCAFCGGTTCVEASTCSASQTWGQCCSGGSCGLDGTCVASDGYQTFTCSYSCGFFYNDAEGCSEISTGGAAVIFTVAFIICFIIVAVLYYRYYSGQKSEILEELRQNLLTPASLSNRGNLKKSAVPQQVF